MLLIDLVNFTTSFPILKLRSSKSLFLGFWGTDDFLKSRYALVWSLWRLVVTFIICSGWLLNVHLEGGEIGFCL